jgi:hypothetical protein
LALEAVQASNQTVDARREPLPEVDCDIGVPVITDLPVGYAAVLAAPAWDIS